MTLHLLRYFLWNRGFNDAVNGFCDDGWSLLDEDVVDDVTIAVNTSSNCYPSSEYNGTMFPAATGVLCAKATMLLQVISLEANIGVKSC